MRSREVLKIKGRVRVKEKPRSCDRDYLIQVDFSPPFSCPSLAPPLSNMCRRGKCAFGVRLQRCIHLTTDRFNDRSPRGGIHLSKGRQDRSRGRHCEPDETFRRREADGQLNRRNRHLLKARFVQQPVEFVDVTQHKGYAAVGTPKWRTAASVRAWWTGLCSSDCQTLKATRPRAQDEPHFATSLLARSCSKCEQ
jgi:hypothetical protein